MSLWSTIGYKVKEIISKMIGARTIEQALHVAPAISSQMEEAIRIWADMYENKAPWLKEPSANDPERVVSLGIPAMIASEKARTALLEFSSDVTAPMKDVEVPNPDYKEPEPDVLGNIIPSAQPPTIVEKQPIGSTERADYLNEQYKKLKKKLRKQFEYAIAKGGMVFKPYPVQGVDGTWNFNFDFIQADNFYPLAFDSNDNITQAAFIQTVIEGQFIYRRLEYHKWENKQVQIVNKCFKSTNNQTQGDINGMDLGQEVALTEVSQWKDMQPTVTVGPVDQPLFAYFRMPQANNIDTSSPLGVSGFSRAKSLIKDADEQYSRLLWEYEAGEMAIDVDRDALNFIEGGTDRDGHRVQGHSVVGRKQQRLYRKVDLGESNTFEPHNPTLRDMSYNTGLNTILMRIEDACEISRGSLSDAAIEAKTATELKILKQRTYSTNKDNQEALQDTLDEIIYIMNVYCDLYGITPAGEYEVSYEWDDSLLVDVDTELGKRITLQQNGLASKVENRMWYFGETEEQAKQALAKIEDENRQAMEGNLMLQSNMNREEVM